MADQKRSRYLRYAAELFIVFLGVWLGLLAEDYRETRHDRQEERTSLGRLIADMDSDVLEITGNLERTIEGHSAARWILAQADARGVPADSLGQQLSRLQYTSIFAANTSEYAALRGSGRIRLIRDPELRRGITKLYEYYPYIMGLHDKDSERLDVAMSQIAPQIRLRVVEGEAFASVDVIGDSDAILSDGYFLREVARTVQLRGLLEPNYRSLLDQIAGLQARARSELGLVEEPGS